MSGDPFFHFNQLLLPLETGTTDYSALFVGVPVSTVGSPVFSSAQTLFGKNTARFASAASYLTATRNTISGVFSLDIWIRLDTPLSGFTIFDNRTSEADAGGFACRVSTAGTIAFKTNNVETVGTTVLSSDTWVLLSWIRSGSTVTGYLNGIQEFTVVCSTNFSRTAERLFASWNAAAQSAAYVSNMRLTLFTRTTSNFSVPAEGWPLYWEGPVNGLSEFVVSPDPIFPVSGNKISEWMGLRRIQGIDGSVSLEGSVTRVPGMLSQRVFLINRKTKMIVRETLTDPLTGQYRFDNLANPSEFQVLCDNFDFCYEPTNNQGTLDIWGTVTDENGTPLQRRICLFRTGSYFPVAITNSDIDGTYRFSDLTDSTTYTVIYEDITNYNYNDIVRAHVSPG